MLKSHKRAVIKSRPGQCLEGCSINTLGLFKEKDKYPVFYFDFDLSSLYLNYMINIIYLYVCKYDVFFSNKIFSILEKQGSSNHSDLGNKCNLEPLKEGVRFHSF